MRCYFKLYSLTDIVKCIIVLRIQISETQFLEFKLGHKVIN
jgi:hypothetical protein